jgi:hypothetical protein
MIKVNGIWYLDSLPMHAVVEMEDGTLAKFFINPFRELTTEELSEDESVYKGYHPRKCKGNPLPNYLYRFYGLEKSEETATEVLHTRMTLSEKQKIEDYAKNNDKSTSEVIREFIKNL